MKKSIHWMSLILLILLSLPVFYIYPRTYNPQIEKMDIYYDWLEGQRILSGENPYARVLEGNMLVNNKYSTYLPGFFLFTAAVQKSGITEYPRFLALWQGINILLTLGLGWLLFYLLWKAGKTWLGVLAAGFWFYNRFTLYVISVYQIDILAIFLIVLSLTFLSKKKVILSLLLMGTSLAVKQIGIVMLPLYLLGLFRMKGETRTIRQLSCFLWVLIVPFMVSLPFLIWNFKGFMYSVLFPMTRLPDTHLGISSLDMAMKWVGIPAKIPMILLWVGIYFIAWFRKIALIPAMLAIYIIFLGYYSILYNQYWVWMVPFMLLSLAPEMDKTIFGTDSPVQ